MGRILSDRSVRQKAENMSSVVLKSASHLYRIFKVYLTLGIIGALAVVTVELVIAKPLALIIGFIAFSFLLMGFCF